MRLLRYKRTGVARVDGNVLALPDMTRNTAALRDVSELPDSLRARRIVLVGLMGAGKTSIGRRLAARLGLPFLDADAEIELAAGCTIPELFARYGEPYFREGEKKVIRRLLMGGPAVIAYGGGAFMDAGTRAATRERATSVWLRCALPTLVRRVASRENRPLLAHKDHQATLAALMARRYPIYAEADVIVDCGDEMPDTTTSQVVNALGAYVPPRRLPVVLSSTRYDVVIGDGLLARAGALLAPVLPQKRAVVVSDANVARLYMRTVQDGLRENGFETSSIIVPAGEATKNLDTYLSVVDQLLEARVERRTAVIALGGGVVGDLAGFSAATTLRGLPFVQIPTTLLSQVDSSVGGKTGVNTKRGKNLVGAFYQPRIVLADTGSLATLPPRELRAGYAEVAKAGLVGDATFFAWCELHGEAVVGGDRDAQGEAIEWACRFKAAVVGDDEREEKPNDGRALLNLGHTFGHALEAEYGYDGGLLHGEGVAVGLGLAFRLSEKLGHCTRADLDRVVSHIAATGMASDLRSLNRRFSAAALIGHMRRDKKVRDGALHFVLARGIGQAFTSSDVPPDAVEELLREEGCGA
ncbi:MAG: 3-dehydroquinate synthase [Acetobacteraceae bacterium]|nr:3-dehydroquinate synthase [Acetobacteraceae bacterium]